MSRRHAADARQIQSAVWKDAILCRRGKTAQLFASDLSVAHEALRASDMPPSWRSTAVSMKKNKPQGLASSAKCSVAHDTVTQSAH